MADHDTQRDPSWLATCAQVREQLDHHRHLRGAGHTTRRWADQQIRALRAGTLREPPRSALHRAGINPTTLTTTETTFLDELDWWVTRHGDAIVPQRATTRDVAGRPYRLGKRVSEARIAHRRATLSEALTRELPQRPGWTWHGQAAKWDLQCAALAEHVAHHHRLPPADSAVYKWLMRQRAKLDTLPPEHARRLAGIPGALVRRDTRVPAFVHAAQTWLAADETRTMAALPYTETIDLDGEAFPLGRRATYYRRRRAGLEGTHPLGNDETALIERLPGWDWTLRDRYRGRRRGEPTPAT